MDSRTYYEKFDWEKANLSNKISDKIDKIIATIPSDVKSILDVGCGDGTITNSLYKKFFAVGLDRSVNALKFVQANKVSASAAYLPFSDNSFDMIFSSEMLEHLPDEIFYSAISEMKRVARKYLFLTFPNDENIEKQVTKCPKCGYVFNKSYHLRTLNIDIAKKLFPEFRLVTKFEYGLKVRDYNRLLSKIKHKFTPAESWIPPFWTTKTGRKTMCPKCEYEFEIPYKFNLLAYSLDLLNIAISSKRHYQICILLERNK